MRYRVACGRLYCDVEASSEAEAREIIVKEITECSIVKWRKARPTSKVGQAKLADLEALYAKCEATEIGSHYTKTAAEVGWRRSFVDRLMRTQ